MDTLFATLIFRQVPRSLRSLHAMPDGKRALATPLFDGKCRSGALRVPRGLPCSRVANARFPVCEARIHLYYAA